jgi:uncharacterized membrane protein YqhA
MVNRLISLTRYVIAIAVVAILAAAVALLFYGAIETVGVIFEAFTQRINSKSGKVLLAAAISIVDIFLVATVLYIVAVGLYALFIDDSVKMPSWLEIHTLDDLKEKLLGVIVVALAVLFLGSVIEAPRSEDLLVPGVVIALVIAAITFFMRSQHKK